MTDFKQVEGLTPRQKHIIESMGKRNQKKPVEPKVEVIIPVPPKPKVDNLMTIGEVASFFRVVPLTIKRWTKAGKLPCIRINSRGDRRYLRTEIDKLIGGK